MFMFQTSSSLKLADEDAHLADSTVRYSLKLLAGIEAPPPPQYGKRVALLLTTGLQLVGPVEGYHKHGWCEVM